MLLNFFYLDKIQRYDRNQRGLKGLTGDAAGVPGHGVGDVVWSGGGDDDPRAGAVQEADPQDAVAAGSAGRQHALIPVDLHVSVRQRGQVAAVKHLDFNLHLCEKNKTVALSFQHGSDN